MSFLLDNLDAYSAALFGAVLQELVHWYGIRAKVSQKRYQAILKSSGYWIITLLVVALFPVGVILWFEESLDALAMRDFVLLGAAFPTLFKTVVSRFSEGGEIKLGAGGKGPDRTQDTRVSFADYLSGR